MDKAHPTPLGSSHPFFAAHTKILSAPEVCEESTLVRLKEEHWEASSQAFDPLSCLLLLSGTATAVRQRCFSSWSSSRCSKSSHHLRALQEAQITEKEGFKVSQLDISNPASELETQFAFNDGNLSGAIWMLLHVVFSDYCTVLNPEDETRDFALEVLERLSIFPHFCRELNLQKVPGGASVQKKQPLINSPSHQRLQKVSKN